MKKVIFFAVTLFFVSVVSAVAQTVTLKLVAGRDYKIANLPSGKIEGNMPMYFTTIAKKAVTEEPISFNVEKSTAEKINSLVIPKDMQLVLYVYSQGNKFVLGSYELEPAKHLRTSDSYHLQYYNKKTKRS